MAARLARQTVLDRKDPPLLWILIDEAVLHREAGSSEVMRGQLMQLAEMSRRPNITIQVVPVHRWPAFGSAGRVRDRGTGRFVLGSSTLKRQRKVRRWRTPPRS